MKSLILISAMLFGMNVHADEIISKKISSVGECELVKTQNALVDVERYKLKVKYQVSKMVMRKEEINLKNYSKHLFVGSAVDGIWSNNSEEESEFLFHPMAGSKSGITSCTMAQLWLKRKLEQEADGADCAGAVVSEDRNGGKVNSFGTQIHKILAPKASKQ